jgi:ABC-type sugar transport system ATPase subunit
MRAGVLQQVGSPEELYTSPQNVFVAGFIGSPSMNLVPVEPGEGGRFRHDGFEIELPERVAGRASGGTVVGFRPEHLRIGEGAASAAGDVRIPATIDVVEYLGDEQLVHLHAGEVDLVAKVPVEPRVRSGQEVELRLPAEKLYLFDRESEESIALDGS